MPPFPTFPVLTTRRIRLREIVPADAPDVFAFRRDPEEQRYNDPPFAHPDEADALIERLARDYREHGAVRWGLALDDDVVVGLFGFNSWDTTNRRASIGYDLKRSLWGHGLATEAMRSILAFGVREDGAGPHRGAHGRGQRPLDPDAAPARVLARGHLS